MVPSQSRFRSFLPLFFLLVAVSIFPGLSRAEPADFAATLKAAEQGDVKAQVDLGVMYDQGQTVPQDYRQAVIWYTRGAEQGDADAQACLGVLYKEGLGVPQDYQRAIQLYTKAAVQGHAKAQVNLAVMYYEGMGVPQNYSLAYVWSSLAAVSGDAKGLSNRDLLAAKLTPQGLAEAQAEAGRIQEEINRTRSKAAPVSNALSRQTKDTAPITRGTGTGFVITADGYILTCAHVVEKAGAIRIKLGEHFLTAKTIRLDQGSDLALLKVDTDQRLPALAFANERSATLGQDVFTIGFPNPDLQGVADKLTKGSVSGLAGAQDDPRFYQISVQVQPGNSGGPLLDFNGNVVGVVKAQLRGDLALETSGSLPQNINYAVKAAYVLSLLDSLPEVAGKLPLADHTPRPFAEVASSAGRGVVQVLVAE